MNAISTRAHGALDYIIIAVLALAPLLLPLGGTAAALCYVVAIVYLILSLLTDYPLGAARLIPFWVHRAVEAMIAVFMIAAPWLFDFPHAGKGVDVARAFFVIMGILIGLLALLSRRRPASLPGQGAMPPGQGAMPPGQGAMPPGQGATPPGQRGKY
jgi:hypothetical protein